MLISRNKVKRLTFERPAASGLTQMVKLKIAFAIFFNALLYNTGHKWPYTGAESEFS